MHIFRRSIVVAACSVVLLTAGAILYADALLAPPLSVGPVVSSGSETVDGSIINVGQAIIGQADDGSRVFAHMGVIPIYTASIPPTLSDCTGNHIVDIGDYDVFQECLVGPDGVLGAGCECADLDGDSDVDLRDAAIHALQY